jgi:hypothetical protein
MTGAGRAIGAKVIDAGVIDLGMIDAGGSVGGSTDSIIPIDRPVGPATPARADHPPWTDLAGLELHGR